MRFRLVYEGGLSSGNGPRPVREKHAIRRHFHPQLKELWQVSEVLRETYEWDESNHDHLRSTIPGNFICDPGKNYGETLADSFSHSGFRFLPLVHKKYFLVCSLNILFLRRENPGDLISVGGDVDNRIKTLLDALRMPTESSELPRGSSPQNGEDPFYCLLESDALVTELSVTTDRLLKPQIEGQNKNDVMLIIDVAVRPTHTQGFHNLMFFG